MEAPSTTLRPLASAVLLLAAASLACNSGSGSDQAQSGQTGAEVQKPGSSQTFFVDPNRSGNSSRLVIEEMFWGRLVDVFDDTSSEPFFRDFLINDIIQTDTTNYVLETNPITQRARLVIQRTRGVADPNGTFDELLRNAAEGMAPVEPYGDTQQLIGNNPDDPSFIPRNATLAIRFNDVLDDSQPAEARLPQVVKVLDGYPPNRSFSPRMLFDRNYGAIVGGEFHSTRLLVDMTVSEEEAMSSPSNPPLNTLGLPASREENDMPNVSVRIPTRVDIGVGQPHVLRNLSGGTLSTNAINFPVDMSVPTNEVVRGMRSGRGDDESNGFLSDLNPPQILGSWPIAVDSAFPDTSSAGTPFADFDFVLEATFTTPCRAQLQPNDIISVNDLFLEVREPSSDPNNQGEVSNVRVRLVADVTVASTDQLLGTGLFQSTYDPAVPVPAGCWVSFVPGPGSFPTTNVPPGAVVQVRFTEPMDPASALPFDTFSVIRGSVDVEPSSTNTVVGEILADPDLREFTFIPSLSFAHQQTGDQYHVELIGGSAGVTDLAGNALQDALPFVLFDIDPATPVVRNGGIVFRFDAVDEVPSAGEPDLRGQFFYNFSRGILRPRPVTFTTAAADRTNPVPGNMIPITTGLQTPLVPLGSKMQTVWRYTDFGWLVTDETKYNLDITGLYWAPVGGQVMSDFYDTFEIALSHATQLPDEGLDTGMANLGFPLHPFSGLIGGGAPFTANILGGAPAQRVVHPRSRGYRVDPASLQANGNGTFIVPFPMNRGLDPSSADYTTYTWRDTTNLAEGANGGSGIPLLIEDPPANGGVGVFATDMSGSIAGPGEVPTIGLPLLIEIRTFPGQEAVGLNAFDVSIATNVSIRPFFRAFSSGGFDQMGNRQEVNPDSELSPTGGFNPTSTPPGAGTTGVDPVFYVGQIDYVTRVSRVHTVWLDTNVDDPDFLDPVLEPLPSTRPVGTDIVIDFRGAEGFDLGAGSQPFDADLLDPYGDPNAGTSTVFFQNGENVWHGDVDDIDEARYFQMRFSFLSNISTRLFPELSAVGVAFDIDE